MSAVKIELLEKLVTDEAALARLSEEDRVAFQHYVELLREFDQPDEEHRRETRRELLSGNDVFSNERKTLDQ